MKLKRGDNVVEVPDLGKVVDVLYTPTNRPNLAFALVEVSRADFEKLDATLYGRPICFCAFPHCITVWPPLGRDGEIIVRYFPPVKEL